MGQVRNNFTQKPIIDKVGRNENGQCVVKGRPRLADAGSEQAFNLVSRWVEACRQRHPECNQTLTGLALPEVSSLPARVLDLANDAIRLFVTNGTKGRYMALSYCWGPPARPPLKTTRDTLTQHLHAIPWDKMPNTFRDAVSVARRLGFQYLWIDSLCIIQDDQQDWIRESEHMGTVYEHADLTIAASHSSSCWDEFLGRRREVAPFVQLTGFAGNAVGIFAHLRSEKAEDAFPEYGNLNSRAWATQEWLLSRRMVFYTPAQLMWSCKKITQAETGDRCFSISRNTHWKHVVEQYSERQLTYKTDKLVALEGLRRGSAAKYGRAYMFGIWRDCIPDQLLWQVTQLAACADDALHLPTWTWAHVPCGIRFLPIRGAKNITTDTSTAADGRTLRVKSMAREVPGFVTHLDDSEIGRAISKDLEATHVENTRAMAKFAVDSAGKTVGWMVFDEWQDVAPTYTVYCLALMSDMSKRDEDKERRRIGQLPPKELREYWVLALQQVSLQEYRRVGVGKIHSREFWDNRSGTLVALV